MREIKNYFHKKYVYTRIIYERILIYYTSIYQNILFLYLDEKSTHDKKIKTKYTNNFFKKYTLSRINYHTFMRPAPSRKAYIIHLYAQYPQALVWHLI